MFGKPRTRYLVFLDDLGAGVALARTRTKGYNDLPKLCHLRSDELTHRFNLHAIGAPAELSGRRRIAFSQEIHPKGICGFGRNKLMAEFESITDGRLLHLRQRLANEIYDHWRLY